MAEWYEEEPGGWDDPRAAFSAAVQHWNSLQEENLWRKRQKELSAARAMAPVKRGIYSQGAPGAEDLTRLPTHIPPELTATLRSERAREPAGVDTEGGYREGVRTRPGGVAGPALPEGYPKPDHMAGWLYPSGKPRRPELPGGERLKEWERVSDQPAMGAIVGPRAKPEGYDAQLAENRKAYYARQENRKQLRREVLRERSKGIRRGEAWGAMRDSYKRAPSEGYLGRARWRGGRDADRMRTQHADKLAGQYGHKDWSAWAAAGGPTQAELNEIRVKRPVQEAKEAMIKWRQSPVVQAAHRERADFKRAGRPATIGMQRGFKMPTLTQITEMAKKERPQGRWVPRKGFVGETRKDVFKRLYDRFDSQRRQLGVELPGFSGERKKLQKLQENYKEAYRNEDFLKNVAGAKTRQREAWNAQIAAGEAAEEEVLAATPTPEAVEERDPLGPPVPPGYEEMHPTPTPLERHLRGRQLPGGEQLQRWEGMSRPPADVPGFSPAAIDRLQGTNREIRELAGTLRASGTPQYGSAGPGGYSPGGMGYQASEARARNNTYTAIETAIQKDMDATAAKVGLSSIPTEAIRMSVGDKRIERYLDAARKRVLKPLQDKIRTGTRAEKEAAQKEINKQVARWKRNYVEAKVPFPPKSWLSSLIG